MSIKYFKTLYFTLIINVLAMFNIIHPIACEEHSQIQEFAVALVPEEKCLKMAINLNQQISKKLPKHINVKNFWHVTLYHGAYDINDLPKIKDKLIDLDIRSFNLIFKSIYNTGKLGIDWGVQNTSVLQSLHESVLNYSSKFIKRPLKRIMDVYDNIEADEVKQVDQFGVYGVEDKYKPHMTLFYQYSSNTDLEKTANDINGSITKNVFCKMDKIIIGRLSYNGNITQILYTINLK